MSTRNPQARATTETASAVFSKSEALYAPLKDYFRSDESQQQGQDEESSSSSTKKKNKKGKRKRRIPQSLSEPALVEFICRVSKDFHRYAPVASIGKNNGNKPISQALVDPRVRQRGITLVSGYNQAPTAAASKKQKSGEQQRVVSNRKRKRAQQNLPTSFPFSEGDQTMMEQLNERWNVYIGRIIPLAALAKTGKRDGDSLETTKQKVFETMRRCELVGAFVHVEECRQLPLLKTKSGYIVEVTKRTWRILVLATEKGLHSRILMIPKVGSVLSVSIAQPPTSESVGVAPKSTISVEIHGDELLETEK